MHLTLQNLTKRFGSKTVLHGLDADFGERRSVVLIGPSGGGKSTLLRILAGLELPDAGTITVNGDIIDFHESTLRNYRRQIGVVFQAFNLFPHLTALQNLTLPLEKVHGHSKERSEELARQTLSRLHLAEHLHQRPGELSGGQKQRVAIARAIVSKPRLLLFDEPTSALDPEMTVEVLDTIMELREEGIDFVLVTHEMGFAQHIADEVVFLAAGQIVEHGPAEQIFNEARTPQCREFLAKVLKHHGGI